MYLLIGGSGGPNYGDELIVKGWLSHLERSQSEIRVEVNVEANARKFHEQKKGVVSFSDQMKKLAKRQELPGFWDQVIRGMTFFERGGDRVHSDMDFSFLSRVSVIHLHGGGYLNSNAPVNGFLLGLCSALRQKYNVTLIATGIGLMPMRKPIGEKKHAMASMALEAFNGIEVRDYESYVFLKECFPHLKTIVMGLDDCFLMDVEEQVSFGKKEIRSLYLSYTEYNLDKFENSYWSGLRDLSSQFDEVVFWECFPWKDKNVLEVVRRFVPGVRLAKAKDFVYGKERLSDSDVLLTNRFHPHLVAARVGVSGVFYSGNKYYDVKHGSVVSVGSSFSKGNYSVCEVDLTPAKGVLEFTGKALHEQKVATYNFMIRGDTSCTGRRLS